MLLDVSGITGCPWGLWGLARHHRDGALCSQGAAIDAILCLSFQDGISPIQSMLSWIRHFHVNLPFASLAWHGCLEPPLEMGFIFPAPSVRVSP